MSEPSKFLFDECSIGKPALEALKGVLDFEGTPPVIAHLLDTFPMGVFDNVWVPKIAGQGWIVISADRGKGKKRGGKLPMICAANGVTCLTLGNRVHHLPTPQKIAVLAMAWKEIAALAQAPPGSRFRMQLSSAGRPFIQPIDQARK